VPRREGPTAEEKGEVESVRLFENGIEGLAERYTAVDGSFGERCMCRGLWRRVDAARLAAGTEDSKKVILAFLGGLEASSFEIAQSKRCEMFVML